MAPKRACLPVPPEDRTVDHADRLASGEKRGFTWLVRLALLFV